MIRECKKKQKNFEINFHYHRNYKKLIDECIKNGTLFSLGSNAHSRKELGSITRI